MAAKKMVVICPKCQLPFSEGETSISVGEDKMWCATCVRRHKPDLYQEIGGLLESNQLSQMLFPGRDPETEFDYD